MGEKMGYVMVSCVFIFCSEQLPSACMRPPLCGHYQCISLPALHTYLPSVADLKSFPLTERILIDLRHLMRME